MFACCTICTVMFYGRYILHISHAYAVGCFLLYACLCYMQYLDSAVCFLLRTLCVIADFLSVYCALLGCFLLSLLKYAVCQRYLFLASLAVWYLIAEFKYYSSAFCL